MNDNLKDIKNRVLKDTTSKHEHGTVYGNLGGVVANHKFAKYPINENESLEDYVKKLEETIATLNKTNKVLKKAILENAKRIETLERKVNTYGLV